MLHKDEQIIKDLLQNLQNVLQNAQKEVCLYVLKKFKYFYVLSLVEYFQVYIIPFKRTIGTGSSSLFSWLNI